MVSILVIIIYSLFFIFTIAKIGLNGTLGILGIIVDERGKYSLSRLQVLAWTFLIGAGYIGIAVDRASFIEIPNNTLALISVILGSAVVSQAIKTYKINTQLSVNAIRDNQLLFSWDGIPGNDDGRLIESLKLNFGLKWLEGLQFVKSVDGKIISVSSGNNSLSLILDDEQSKVELKINDYRTYELIAKMVNGKLNIYNQSMHPSLVDIISEEEIGFENRLSIGKFQMLVWTVISLAVYTVILLTKTTSSDMKELPDVTITMVMLMVLSNGAYLILKIPRRISINYF